uniref:SCY1-like protein 2 n=1 Tax=Rhizophora mucronata TaxID=61149 RepID=A0A2P2LXF0_RHIMU
MYALCSTYSFCGPSLKNLAEVNEIKMEESCPNILRMHKKTSVNYGSNNAIG